ncbi:MAG: Helix-turn-helix domain, partial [Bacteroidota bacterium]
MNIGERLKEIRVAKGLTQVDLSNKSGIAIRTV